jgi:hypothetical protein
VWHWTSAFIEAFRLTVQAVKGFRTQRHFLSMFSYGVEGQSNELKS